MGKRIIGLDIDEGFLIASELLRDKASIALRKYWKASALKELLIDKGSSVVINLPTQLFLFRSFHLAPSFLKTANNPKGLARFLLSQNLPFKLEECFWDTFILGTTLNLIAAKKEIIEKYIQQVEEAGLRCAAINPSFMALYDVFIYNYPEKEKEGFAILNIRNSASDLLIYESKRIWVYPLSTGRINLQDSKEAMERFSTEVQRIFSAHYLHNPSAASAGQKRGAYLALSGQLSAFEGMSASLKSALGEFEVTILEPFKEVAFLKKPSLNDGQLMATSLGLSLAYLNAPGCIKINLIKEKAKSEFLVRCGNLTRKTALSFGVLSLLFLFFWDISLIKNLKAKRAVYKNTRFLVSSVLPEAKILKGKIEALQKLQGYLEMELRQHKLYLKALAHISEGKPNYVEIREVEAKQKDASLLVSLSASAAAYEEVNDFSASLKKNKDVTDVKIVFSSFPSDAVEGITFKLRFQVQ